jgi:hypothetical protein
VEHLGTRLFLELPEYLDCLRLHVRVPELIVEVPPDATVADSTRTDGTRLVGLVETQHLVALS